MKFNFDKIVSDDFFDLLGVEWDFGEFNGYMNSVQIIGPLSRSPLMPGLGANWVQCPNNDPVCVILAWAQAFLVSCGPQTPSSKN